jgi:hypothetical protein
MSLLLAKQNLKVMIRILDCQNVEENIKKSRRSAYGLFGGGFHGNNGLDPETTR